MDGNGHKSDELEEILREVVDDSQRDVRSGQREGRTFSAVDKQQLGVLQSMLRAIQKTDEYRQELKTANWEERREAMLAVAAIHERQMCGVDITPIIDRIIAESAGVASGRLELIIRGLTHTTFNTNYPSMTKQHWWNRKPRVEVSSNDSVPLS